MELGASAIVKIKKIHESEFIASQDITIPNYIVIDGIKFSSLNVLGVVINKSDNSLTIEDGTGNIEIRVFDSYAFDLSKINISDLVLVIGRPRKFGSRIYISPTIIRKVDEEWIEFRKIQIEFFEEWYKTLSEKDQIEIREGVVKDEFENKNIDQTYDQTHGKDSAILTKEADFDNNFNTNNINNKSEDNHNTSNEIEEQKIVDNEYEQEREKTIKIKKEEDIEKNETRKELEHEKVLNTDQNEIIPKDNESSQNEPYTENMENSKETENDIENKIISEINKKKELLKFIQENDPGDGTDYSLIIEKFGSEIDGLLNRLLEEGDIFEVKAGKYKVLD